MRSILGKLLIGAVLAVHFVSFGPVTAIASSEAYAAQNVIGDAFGRREPAPPRFALVIGNANYLQANWSLNNPVPDARLIAGALEGAGFDPANIDLIEDADAQTMNDALLRYRNKLRAAGPDAVGVLYFAGHGLQVDNENYLVPVSARMERRTDVDTQAINLEVVTRAISRAGNRVNIVILDACRNDPFPPETRGAPVRGLARVGAADKAGFYLAFAAAPGRVALDAGVDDESGNSPYARALARRLRDDAHVPVELMFKHIANDVYEATNQFQIAWNAGFIPGDDFCFGGCDIERDEEGGPLQILVSANDPDARYRTITAALNDIADGGAIYIDHGVYRESLVISKSVFIRGDRAPGEGAEIRPPINASCLDIRANDPQSSIVVQNIRFNAEIASRAPCIKLLQGNLVLKDSDVLGSGAAPAVAIYGGAASLERNRISSGSEGVLIDQPHSLSRTYLLDNKILMNKHGVMISGRSDLYVSMNEIFDNLDAGIVIEGIGASFISSNYIHNNAGSGVIADADGALVRITSIRLNRIFRNGGDGIAFLRGNGLISDNEILGNDGEPIFVRDPEPADLGIENNYIDTRRSEDASGRTDDANVQPCKC